MYQKVLGLPIGFFNEKRRGDLMSRMTNDVNEVEASVIGTLEGWIRDPLTIIVTLAVLFLTSFQLTLFILILIQLILITMDILFMEMAHRLIQAMPMQQIKP